MLCASALAIFGRYSIGPASGVGIMCIMVVDVVDIVVGIDIGIDIVVVVVMGADAAR